MKTFFNTNKNHLMLFIKTKSVAFYFIGFISLSVNSFGQSIPKLQDPQNQFIIDKSFQLESEGGLIYYKENALNVGELFTTYLAYTGLGVLDSMVLVKTWRDSILDDENSPAPNVYHTLYQQFYNGIKVEGAEYTLHHDGTHVLVSSGFIAENLNIPVVPSITSQNALAIALTNINAVTWVWDSIESRYPTGELLIIPMNNTDGTLYFRLSWKFNIVALNPWYNSNVYVDAQTGVVLKDITNIHSGDFTHIYYGAKTDLDTRYRYMWWTSDRWYISSSGARNIYTTDAYISYNNSSGQRNYKNNDSWGFTDMPYSSGDDHWGYDYWSATNAHYCASKSWDYFKQTPLNRTGMTGWGKELRIVADYPFNNAAYEQDGSSDYLVIGRINNNYLATYDIIGHEFTHGVTQNSKPLPMQKASGAINESFSDIFGFMVERYSIGYIKDWTIGEDANSAFRDLQNPNSYAQPSYYLQSPYWVNTVNYAPSASNDNCGVHTNSGVQNKWFNPDYALEK